MNLKRTTCTLLLFSCLVLLLLAALVAIIVKHWATIQPNFYDIKLTDVLQICLTLLVALFITYLIRVRTDCDLKRYEIISKVIDELRDDLHEIFELGKNYVRLKNESSGRQKGELAATEAVIRQKLKTASTLLSMTHTLTKSEMLVGYDNFGKGSKNCFIAFKRALTNNPFGSRGTYTDSHVTQINTKYYKLVNVLYSYKLSLYS